MELTLGSSFEKISAIMRYLSSFLSLLAFGSAMADSYQTVEVEDKDYWLSSASAKLDQVLKRQEKNSFAKNIVIFVGDGMGMTTITAGRIYQGQIKKKDGEMNVLSFEKFPATGLSKTYNFEKQVPDSASSATAIFTGVKTRQEVLGLDPVAHYNSCMPETNKKATVTSFMTWAQKSGRDTGIVTTTRITHATPAATYSHINNRDWECDSVIPKSDMGCVKDIARQLVEDAPGKYYKVILGGGRNQLGDTSVPKDHHCVRTDGRNLVTEWKNSKGNSKYVVTAEELSKVDVKNTDYLLGLFSPGHIPYVADNNPTRPSLKLMTETAIKMLKKNSRGFVLMVEGGRIDHGHHDNKPGLALSELVDFDEAVEAAVSLTDPNETLIIVTADHSHAMTLNGYPNRGNDILGLAKNDSDGYYETITYANGPGFKYHHLVQKQESCVGSNCTQDVRESTSSWKDIRNDTSRKNNLYYEHLSALYLVQETHGGEDVPIYASGPMSHLLIGVHEQNYIATVMSYAGCMGPEAHRCIDRRPLKSASTSPFLFNNIIFNSVLALTAILLHY